MIQMDFLWMCVEQPIRRLLNEYLQSAAGPFSDMRIV